jgi:hypothetical protein
MPTRLYVIELAIYLETSVNETLGALLNINPAKSKSLGNQSSALSFNQKIILLQDVQNISKIDFQRLEFLMRIRNKFAHVHEVSSFKMFFDTYDTKGEVQKYLKKWYYNPEDSPNISEEELYKYYFNCLAFDITYFLNNLLSNILNNKRIIEGVPLGKILRTNDYLMALFEELKKHENGDY